MNRQQRRNSDKTNKQSEMQEKMVLFEKMGNKCDACSQHFDNKNKEQVTTWTVMVYNEEQSVKLYCPGCRSDIQAWAEDSLNV